jgi:2-oxoglutarate ferredoxin oxidoreductase subunit alpha
MKRYPQKKDDIAVVLSGAAGQGIQTVEELLTRLFKSTGYNLFSTKEYMSRVRGGSNSTSLRVSSSAVRARLDRIDILFPLNREALLHVAHRITDDTIILGEKEVLLKPGIEGKEDSAFEILDIPLTKIAKEIGGAIYANIIAVGVVSALFNIRKEAVFDELQRRFSGKGEAIVANNVRAVEQGYAIGKSLVDDGIVSIIVETDPGVADNIAIGGGEAIALGAIAGGCNFISSYPMTPSTSVLTFLAHHSKDFDIVVDQAEDEIAAINMGIGAWYAGARAMVTTSGGGFDLMTEGLSLAGMLETPMVIHLGQRPGPATGLPTRTEQGDLELAVYSGHGEFPRAILSPGTLEQAFELSAKAFEIADKYQVPVFIMSDQYLVDTYYNQPRIDVSEREVVNNVVKTEADYRRYAITESGVSPRGIPGYGEGLVDVDSDEHDENGHITEDCETRIKMVEKRMRKTAALKSKAIAPQIVGKERNKTAVVCWGSVFNIAQEALDNIAKQTGRDDISLVHFSQVYPLHSTTEDVLNNFDELVIVENNATFQFLRLLKAHTNIDIDGKFGNRKINRYDGLAFSVEELERNINDILISNRLNDN